MVLEGPATTGARGRGWPCPCDAMRHAHGSRHQAGVAACSDQGARRAAARRAGAASLGIKLYQ
jgi:hypothetical protein